MFNAKVKKKIGYLLEKLEKKYYVGFKPSDIYKNLTLHIHITITSIKVKQINNVCC